MNNATQTPEPLVSLIIPTYNVERYLVRCLESVVGQTYTRLQILPVNDGSTDNSGKILDRYAEQDSRIQVIHQNNRGLMGARKTGISHADGDYVCFIDADDWIEPQYVETLLQRAVETGADVTVCLRQAVWDDGTVQPGPREFLSEDWLYEQPAYIRKFMAGRITSSLCTKLFKRGVLVPEDCDFPRIYSACEDHVITCGTLRRIRKAAGVGHILYNYYMRTNSITHTFSPKIDYYKKLFAIADEKMGSELARKYRTDHQCRLLKIYLGLIFAKLYRENRTYKGTKEFEEIRLMCRRKELVALLPFGWKIKAGLVRHSFWLHGTMHLFHLLKHRKKWQKYIRIENP